MNDARLTRREIIYRIIFYADTPAGKAFDVLLIASILLSVLVVLLDSVNSLNAAYGDWFDIAEWAFTLLFTLEYLVRIACSPAPRRYIFSFYGVVDLLSIIPTYLSLVVPNSEYLLVVRLLRVMRLFRVLRLSKYVSQANLLVFAIRQSRQKITVFLFFILVLVTIFGSLMYLIEGPDRGFTSIPRSIYWAIVTLTTVGYGDISPQTDIGQAIAALVMIMGYSILAVPTGIFTAELANAMQSKGSDQSCQACGKGRHDIDARHCNACGTLLTREKPRY